MVGAGAVILWLFLLGLKNGYEYSLGAFLRKLADMVDDIWVVGGPLGRAFDRADELILEGIGSGLHALESVISKWWAGMEWLARQTYNTMAEFADDTYETFKSVVSGVIPDSIETGTLPQKLSIGKLRRWMKAEAERLMVQIVRRAHGLELALERDFGKAWRGIDNIRGVSIPRLWRWARGAEATLRDLSKRVGTAIPRRLTRLEQLVLGTALTAAGIAALTRVFPYWQCTNVKRWNRMLCRAPIGALDDLLGLALLTVGSLSIVDFAKAMAPVTEFVTDEVHGWITED